MKKCSSKHILNPKTNRCVLKTGKIGQSLLNNGNAKDNSDFTIEDSICSRIGMRQYPRGTCWFNSIFNNFLLSEYCYKFFIKKANKVKITKIKDTCPLQIKKEHFYNFLNDYKNQTPIELINKFSIRSVDWDKRRQGYRPLIALKKILPI